MTLIANAARLWAQGFNTDDIAKVLRVPESRVSNNINAIRAEARRITKDNTHETSHPAPRSPAPARAARNR